MLHAHAGLTYEDYLAFPEDGRRHELLGGDHVVTPSPAPAHQRAVAAVFRALDAHVRDTGAGEVWLSPLDVVLSLVDVVVPDLIFVPAAQAALVTRERVVGAPALVVEVLSPGTCVIDRTRKRRLYERSGVQEFWLIEPDEGTVDVFSRTGAGRFGAARRLTGRGADVLTTPLLSGFALPVRSIVDPGTPPTAER